MKAYTQAYTRSRICAFTLLAAVAGVLLPAYALAATPCKAGSTTACTAPKAKPAAKPAAAPTKKKAAPEKAKPAAKKAAPKTTAKAATKKSTAKKPAVQKKTSERDDDDAAGLASLKSSSVLVQDVRTSDVLFSRNDNVARPIASISKLMTALVTIDAKLPMNEEITVTDDDIDTLKHSGSRLPVGTHLTRADMLHVALMASENRAAHALGRTYPGGMAAFVAAMNAKARELGMVSARFVEPTGLSSENVASPQDLVLLLEAASKRPLIHQFTTDDQATFMVGERPHPVLFRNTNALVRSDDWDIQVSKTGYINEAGRCLVMMTRIAGRELAIVLLDSQGKLSRIGDAVRVKRIVQNQIAML